MALTSAPTLIVEVGFASDPTASIAGTTWTDVTAYCRALKTRAGRQHELQRVEASTADLVFDNTDGRFDPTNTSSPYYPNVTTDKRLRIRATWNAITYPVFCGFVESWGTQWPEVTEAFMAVTAADGLKAANLVTLRSPYVEQVLADSPAGYWRLHEANATLMAADISGNSRTGRAWVGAPTFAVAGPITDGEAAGAVQFNDATSDYLVLGNDIDFNAQPVTVEMWIKGARPAVGQTLTLLRAGDFSSSDNLAVGSSGLINWAGKDTVTNGDGYVLPNDGLWHHLVVTRDSVSPYALTLYVDKVSHMAVNAGVGSTMKTGSIYIGRSPAQTGVTVGASAVIGDVAIYLGTLLSATRIGVHYDTRSAYLGQLSGGRINAILDILGWATADRNVEAGVSTLQSIPVVGNALAHMTDVAKSENGLLFQAPDGKMTFLQRWHLFTTAVSTASQATFGDGAAQLPYILSGINPVLDDIDLYNEVQETRNGGALQRVTDSSSATKHGRRSLAETGLLIQSDAEALDRAGYLLARYKTPVTRVRSFTVTGQSDPANLFPHMLGRSLWDRITFRRQPPGGGTQFLQDSIIEGIEHQYSEVGAWRTTFRLSAADTTQYLVLDDATFGKLDSNAIAY